MQCLNRIGIETLSRRIHHHHIRTDALLFQLQRRLSRVAAEKFRIVNTVALGVLPGIHHCLLHHLHANDLAGGFGHSKGDCAHAAVQIQHQIVFGNLRLGDGGLIQPLGLMVIDLIKGAGGQPESKAAEGVFNVAGAVQSDEFLTQNGVARLGVHGKHQTGKSRHGLKPVN